jgi:hypothetical protein
MRSDHFDSRIQKQHSRKTGSIRNLAIFDGECDVPFQFDVIGRVKGKPTCQSEYTVSRTIL